MSGPDFRPHMTPEGMYALIEDHEKTAKAIRDLTMQRLKNNRISQQQADKFIARAERVLAFLIAYKDKEFPNV